MPRRSPVRSWLTLDRTAAVRHVLTVARECRGSVQDAAVVLRMSEVSLHRALRAFPVGAADLDATGIPADGLLAPGAVTVEARDVFARLRLLASVADLAPSVPTVGGA